MSKNSYPVRRILAAAALSAASLGAAACGGNSKAQSPAEGGHSSRPTPESTYTGGVVTNHASPKVGKVALNNSNFCAWSPDSPEPLVSRRPLVAQIDGRCAFPENVDTVGVYPEPTHHSLRRFSFHSGTDVLLVCQEVGQSIGDGADVESRDWVSVREVSDRQYVGFVPAFAVGYDTAGVAHC